MLFLWCCLYSKAIAKAVDQNHPKENLEQDAGFALQSCSVDTEREDGVSYF